MTIGQIFLYLFLVLVIVESNIDYCKTACNENHILCNSRCNAHDRCGTKFSIYPLADEDCELIVFLHNIVRNKAARGMEGAPSARNMLAISYSKELAFLAQCFAATCFAEGKHDECRAISGYDEVGQNTFIFHRYLGFRNHSKMLRLAIAKWTSTLALSETKEPSFYKSYPYYFGVHPTYEFVQIIWAKTEYIGCGRVVYGTSINIKFGVVCNYATAGAIKDQEIFEVGKPLTNCPPDRPPGMKFRYLCGDPKPLGNDTFNFPFSIEGSGTKLQVFYFYIILIPFIHINRNQIFVY